MKKISILLCAIIALSMQLCLADESDKKYLFKTDFETAPGYVNNEGVFEFAKFFSSAGLSTSLSASAGDVLEVRGGSGNTGNALYASVEGRTSGIPSFTIPKSYTPNNDILILEFDVKCPTRFTAYSFPNFSVLQGWFGVGAGDTTNMLEDYRYSDLSVTGSNQWGNAGTYIKYGTNAVWYHYKFAIDFSTTTYALSINAEDNSFNYSKDNIPFRNSAASVSNVSFDLRGGSVMMDNLELYTMDKMKLLSSTLENNQTSVAVEQSQEFAFSQTISTSSLSEVTISSLEEGDYLLSLKDEKTVLLSYLKHLAYNTSYTVDFSKLMSNSGLYANGEKISFTTEAKPQVTLESYQIFKGLGQESAQQPSFAADNSFQNVQATVSNNTPQPTQATLMLALYNQYGYLCKMTCTKSQLEANEIKIMGAGTTIENTLGGGTVKMYLWNDAYLMKPWSVNITNALE